MQHYLGNNEKDLCIHINSLPGIDKELSEFYHIETDQF